MATTAKVDEIVDLLRQGISSNEIAQRLNVTPPVVWGVKSHWRLGRYGDTELEGAEMELTRTIQIIHALADGLNPQTGEAFHDDSPYQHPETIRALFTALSTLDAYRDMASRHARNWDHPSSPAEHEEIELTPQQEEIYERLRQWRSKKAHDEGFASFMILHNSQMKQMVALPVTCTADLLTIKGFGEKRTKKYGDEILAVVNRATDQSEN